MAGFHLQATSWLSSHKLAFTYKPPWQSPYQCLPMSRCMPWVYSPACFCCLYPALVCIPLLPKLRNPTTWQYVQYHGCRDGWIWACKLKREGHLNCWYRGTTWRASWGMNFGLGPGCISKGWAKELMCKKTGVHLHGKFFFKAHVAISYCGLISKDIMALFVTWLSPKPFWLSLFWFWFWKAIICVSTLSLLSFVNIIWQSQYGFFCGLQSLLGY